MRSGLTSSGSCAMAGLGISNAETSNSTEKVICRHASQLSMYSAKLSNTLFISHIINQCFSQ
jgi:hypothetical protein